MRIGGDNSADLESRSPTVESTVPSSNENAAATATPGTSETTAANDGDDTDNEGLHVGVRWRVAESKHGLEVAT